jgi:hypothetical protein
MKVVYHRLKGWAAVTCVGLRWVAARQLSDSIEPRDLIYILIAAIVEL